MILPINNNILIKYNKIKNASDFSTTIVLNLTCSHLNIGDYSQNTNRLIFSIEKQNNIFKFKNKINFNTEDFNELKKHTKEFCDNFYNEFTITEFDNITQVPVFNTDKYSDFILDFIKNEPIQIKYIKYIKQFLNEKTLKYFKHILDANNFDLI